MPPMTIEAVIENGQVRLPDRIALPENAKVYVVIPDMDAPQSFQILSPRLMNQQDAAKFAMNVTEVQDDADV